MSVSVRMIIDLNIQHYRDILKTETDASKRQTISKFTRSWLEFQSSHSRQCVGSTKTGFPVEACTHPLSVRRQGKTRECTSSFSCTLSCRLRSNGAVNIGCQSRIIALFCYCSRAQIFQENTGRAHRRFALYQNSPISSSTHRKTAS